VADVAQKEQIEVLRNVLARYVPGGKDMSDDALIDQVNLILDALDQGQNPAYGLTQLRTHGVIAVVLNQFKDLVAEKHLLGDSETNNERE
jgi:hypothetical protein